MKKHDPEKSITEYMLTLLHTGDDFDLSDIDPNNPVNIRIAKKLRAFIDEIPGGFLVYHADVEEKIIYANKSLIDIFKCKTFTEFMKLTGGTFKGVVHPDDLARVEDEITKQVHLGNNDFDYTEYRIIRKDGIVRWVEDFGHLISNKTAGKFFYVFITDATEKIARRIVERAELVKHQKVKEQQMQSLIEEFDKERKLISREHLQRLEVIEGLSENYASILYVDLDEDIVLPYRLSTRLERQFNKKFEERSYKWFAEDYVKVWVHPDDRHIVRDNTSVSYIKQRLSQENTYYFNYRCIENGELKYLQIRISNVSKDDGISQIVIGYRSIDDEMRTEMIQKGILQEALEKSRIADIAKSTFLSNMSHDMRTPLNAIFGYVELARKTVDSPEQTKTYLNKIELESKHILDLVENVLELSYSETQNITLEGSEFSLTEIMQAVYCHIIHTADLKDIKISVDMSGVKHDSVISDKNKLQKLLYNIVNNAVKFTHNGGQVDICVRETKSNSSEYGTFTFNVHDTGIGISPDALDRIFEPFERIQNTTMSGMYGSGLGLTISKMIAESMGGIISAASEPGKGSTFTVTVSLKLNKQDSEQTDSEAFDPTGTKVLIVEDNEINMEIETEILQDLGFVIDCAANGKIAVEKITASSPGDYDLVLMDIQMPVMNGHDASRAIRALNDPRLAGIPIIALSANAFESDRRASIEAGMDEHLTKPLDVDELFKTMKTVFSARTE